ncbi:MAG: aldehyde dehydrogenase family protein [FCB group bacterium]|nr:aldehyde dehydrogenase family protein [FCB group bacterium]
MMEKQQISGSPNFPVTQVPERTSAAQIESALDSLISGKDRWPRLGIPERISLLDEIHRDMSAQAHRWVELSRQAKGIPPKAQAAGEEWIQVSQVFRMLRILRQSLTQTLRFGKPRLPRPLRMTPGGQVTAQVFPGNFIDRLLYRGITAEVRMQPGISIETVEAEQAWIYRQTPGSGGICLVLAAGNISTISVVDFMYKLFVENQVVILKTNPVNAYINPVIEEGFRALIKRNYLKIIYGGAEEGSILCRHSKVDRIHLTGSDKTFEAILFGPGAEGQRRKLSRTPLLQKPVTAELGNISPIIVVPGPWREKDFHTQGVKLASWLTVNAGFNCLSPRLVVQHAGWQDRHRLSESIGHVLSQVPIRKAYYPGAEQRFAEFLQHHPDALKFGEASPGYLPWTYIEGIDPKDREDICFRQEAFCSLMAETGLKADSVPEFIDEAVKFVNDTVWGSLVMSILVHPDSLKDPEISAALERAVDGLHYGTVCINLRAEYAYLLAVTPWGAYPGHDVYDIQSGTGVVNNLLMFRNPQKSVIRGPFNPFPDPVSATSASLEIFGRRLAGFENKPSLLKLPGLLYSAIRG